MHQHRGEGKQKTQKVMYDCADEPHSLQHATRQYSALHDLHSNISPYSIGWDSSGQKIY